MGPDIIIFSVFNQVKSERFVTDIGFKTRVTLGDILDILKSWRKSSKTSFKARYESSYSYYLREQVMIIWDHLPKYF